MDGIVAGCREHPTAGVIDAALHRPSMALAVEAPAERLGARHHAAYPSSTSFPRSRATCETEIAGLIRRGALTGSGAPASSLRFKTFAPIAATGVTSNPHVRPAPLGANSYSASNRFRTRE